MCFSQPKSNAAKETTPEYVAPPDSETYQDGARTKRGGVSSGATVRGTATGLPPVGFTGMPLATRRTSATLGI
ncbi:hypothetical protein [Nostoc phage NMeng1]|nr:hypothetical protein [Nostoc phage NMeng1]